MTDDLDPWDRQPNEPGKAFAAFTAYRDLGHTRSLRRIGRNEPRAIAEHAENTWPMQSLGNWSTKYGWVDRAAQFDRHLDRVAIERQEERRREMVDQHDALSTQMLNIVARGLVGDETTGVKPLDVSKLKPAELVRMFAEAVKVQRISRGEPTEISQQQGPGGGPVQHVVDVRPKDEEEELARLQGLEDLGELPTGTVTALRALGGGEAPAA